MSEQEEYYASDNVMKIMQPVKEYKTEKDFTSLKAWQKARDVKLFFYKNILPRLPKEEKYSLNIQIRKASVSSTANIAEGYGRYHKKLKNQFYYTARASVYECIPILTISLNQKYITKSEYDELYDECHELSRMISGLIDSINKRNTN